MKFLIFLIFFVVLSVVSPLLADDSVEIHGFLSQGFLDSTDNNYILESNGGSYDFRDLGITITKVVSDKTRVGIQLVNRKMGYTTMVIYH